MLKLQRIEKDGSEGKEMPIKGRVVTIITKMARIVAKDDQARDMRLLDDQLGEIARVVSYGSGDLEVRMPLDKFLKAKIKRIRVYENDSV